MRQSMIFMVPKFTGAAYFAATEKGAKEAVAELNGKGVAIDFLYTGPGVANTDEQIRIIDELVAQKPDAIIIAPNQADALVPVAQKAKTSGIKVITYDADVADPTARQWFVNQGTFTLVGAALVAQASLAGNLKDNATQAKVPAGRLGTRDAVASLQDITAKGPLTLKNV